MTLYSIAVVLPNSSSIKYQISWVNINISVVLSKVNDSTCMVKSKLKHHYLLKQGPQIILQSKTKGFIPCSYYLHNRAQAKNCLNYPSKAFGKKGGEAML